MGEAAGEHGSLMLPLVPWSLIPIPVPALWGVWGGGKVEKLLPWVTHTQKGPFYRSLHAMIRDTQDKKPGPHRADRPGRAADPVGPQV